MSAQDVCQALKAGQDAGRLPELAEGADVPALLEALSYDSLNVSSGWTEFCQAMCTLVAS